MSSTMKIAPPPPSPPPVVIAEESKSSLSSSGGCIDYRDSVNWKMSKRAACVPTSGDTAAVHNSFDGSEHEPEALSLLLGLACQHESTSNGNGFINDYNVSYQNHDGQNLTMTGVALSSVENKTCNDVSLSYSKRCSVGVLSKRKCKTDVIKTTSTDIKVPLKKENEGGRNARVKGEGYSRKDKSLGLLCDNFLSLYRDGGPDRSDIIRLDQVSGELKVERRRIYDIVNVLESISVVVKIGKIYKWVGTCRMNETLARLKDLAHREFSPDLSILSGSNSNHRVHLGGVPFEGSQLSGMYPNYTAFVSSTPVETSSAVTIPKCPSVDSEPRSPDCGSVGKPTSISTVATGQSSETPHIGSSADSNGRRDKSLGIMAQRFLMLFLISHTRVIALVDAARVLMNDDISEPSKIKTKVRRLYDIANVLSALHLIQKLSVMEAPGRKPAFKWIGPNIDELDSTCQEATSSGCDLNDETNNPSDINMNAVIEHSKHMLKLSQEQKQHRNPRNATKTVSTVVVPSINTPPKAAKVATLLQSSMNQLNDNIREVYASGIDNICRDNISDKTEDSTSVTLKNMTPDTIVAAAAAVEQAEAEQAAIQTLTQKTSDMSTSMARFSSFSGCSQSSVQRLMPQPAPPPLSPPLPADVDTVFSAFSRGSRKRRSCDGNNGDDNELADLPKRVHRTVSFSGSDYCNDSTILLTASQESVGLFSSQPDIAFVDECLANSQASQSQSRND